MLLFQQSLLLQKLENHLKYVLPFSAMDDSPTYGTGHPILPKNQVQKIPGQFVNKTGNFSRQKNLLI